MNVKWPLVQLSEILTERKEIPDPAGLVSGDIRIIAKIGFDSGKMEFRLGGATRTKMILIRPGDLVLSGINAAKGAIALYGDNEKHPASATIHYSAYSINKNKADINFLWHYFRSHYFKELLEHQLPNGIKTELKASKFLMLKVPMPPLEEQKRILKFLVSQEKKVQLIRSRAQKSKLELQAFIKSFAGSFFKSKSNIGHLNEILDGRPRNGWSARCDNSPNGIPVLTLAAVTGFTYKQSEYKLTSLPTNPDAHYWLEPGDLLITRSNTPELVGHAAIYSGKPSPCIYPDLIMKIPVNEKLADKEFVWMWLQSSFVRDFITEHAKGTSPTMKKISQKLVESIPWPKGVSLSEQRTIVCKFRKINSRAQQVMRRHERLLKVSTAYIESIKNKVFRGKLV